MGTHSTGFSKHFLVVAMVAAGMSATASPSPPTTMSTLKTESLALILPGEYLQRVTSFLGADVFSSSEIVARLLVYQGAPKQVSVLPLSMAFRRDNTKGEWSEGYQTFVSYGKTEVGVSGACSIFGTLKMTTFKATTTIDFKVVLTPESPASPSVTGYVKPVGSVEWTNLQCMRSEGWKD